jgi:hypothetical protein
MMNRFSFAGIARGRPVPLIGQRPLTLAALVFLVVGASGASTAVDAQARLTDNTLQLDSGAVSAPARATDFAFLTGRWTGEGLGGAVEELWGAPEAGTMLGTFRLVEGGRPTFYEFFALEEYEGTVAFRLKHFDPGPGLRGWEERDRETLFRLVRVEPGRAWFHGLTFLQEGPDSLTIFLALRGADRVLREEIFRLRRAGG